MFQFLTAKTHVRYFLFADDCTLLHFDLPVACVILIILECYISWLLSNQKYGLKNLKLVDH